MCVWVNTEGMSDYHYNSVLTPDSNKMMVLPQAALCIKPVIQALLLAGMQCSFTSFI